MGETVVVREGGGGGFDGGVGVGGVFERGWLGDRQRFTTVVREKESKGKERKNGRTFEIAAALGLEFLPPSPDGVEDETHAHAAFHFEPQRAVGAVIGGDHSSRARSTASPKLGQDFGKPIWEVVVENTYGSDGLNGTVE